MHSGILSARLIEKVVRELSDVMKRQKDRYMERMIRYLDNIADDPEDVLGDTMRVLDEIERSVERLVSIPSLFAALILNWFYAVLIESEDLIKELYDAVESGDEYFERDEYRR
jgi:hypothetical protein